MEQKYRRLSKTVRSGIITSVASLLTLLGIFQIDANLQAQILVIITSIATAVGGVLAIIGRFKATTQLVTTKDPTPTI